jgi:hypothetical protein
MRLLSYDCMKHDHDTVHIVGELIKAEDERDRTKAESFLAQNFIAITRARGEEQNKEQLLSEIANPKNPNLIRKLEREHDLVLESGNLAVIRSLVTTIDRTKPDSIPEWYRNIHVLVKEQGNWRCIAWQVTKLNK